MSSLAVETTFARFAESYELTGVTVTDRELGHGSYATVLQLDYMGLKCAGKKIHEVLLRQGDTSYTVRRFEEECRLLSQVRHPNIVQFLGVHFQEGVPAPVLVMEFLPTNLTSCIEQYGILPKEISYSILHDVALGLCYLHSQTPPIIHRDLSSNNVLLTANMTAKISDLGVARILNLTPLQVSRMTETPGTPAYMPPEVMIANPKYGTSVDVFSYGIMMIHMFSGRWPEPQVGPNRFEGDQLIPITEAERREVFLRVVTQDHPLMDLILKCINNNPKTRAGAGEIISRLAEIVLQFPASFANRLEMARQIEHQENEKRLLKIELDSDIQTKEEKIQCMSKELQTNEDEFELLRLECSIQTSQLQLEVEDLKSQNQQLKAESESEVKELKSKSAVFEVQLENTAMVLQQERDQFEKRLSSETEQLAIERGKLSKQRELNRKLVGDIHELKSDLMNSRSSIKTLQGTVSKLEADIVAKESVKNASMMRKDVEIRAKVRAIQQKDAIIVEMNEQLGKVKEYLSTKKQVSLS